MIEWKHWLSKPAQEPNDIINENIQINKYKTNRHLIWGQSNVCMSSYERCCTNPFMGYIKKKILCARNFLARKQNLLLTFILLLVLRNTPLKKELCWFLGETKILVNLQSFKKYLILTLFFMWNSALREKLNFCFSRVFC